jgi:hypothetical protein
MRLRFDGVKPTSRASYHPIAKEASLLRRVRTSTALLVGRFAITRLRRVRLGSPRRGRSGASAGAAVGARSWRRCVQPSTARIAC